MDDLSLNESAQMMANDKNQLKSAYLTLLPSV